MCFGVGKSGVVRSMYLLLALKFSVVVHVCVVVLGDGRQLAADCCGIICEGL